MDFLDRCPRRGGPVAVKEVTEVLHGGVDTAILRVAAGVCTSCGERLYTPTLVRRFEEFEAKLERRETAEFHPLGWSFEVEPIW